MAITPRPAANGRAIAFMILAMASFALADTTVSALAGLAGAGAVIAVGGAVTAASFGAAMAWRGERVDGALLSDRVVIARTLGEMAATGLFVSALLRMPLADATAIAQAQPLLVTLGAAWVLGERVGRRRWAALTLGFGGVLVITRPGGEGFDPAALLALGAVLGLTVRDLATRALDPAHPTTAVAFVVGVVLVPLGFAIWAAEGAVVPDPAVAGRLVLASLFAVGGYWAITLSMRLGEVSAVAPFRYVRLPFAAVLAVAVLGEWPDAATLIGGAMVVGAGLATVLDERRARRRPRGRVDGSGPLPGAAGR